MWQVILEYGFLQRALWIGLFSSLLSATLGVYVVINHLGSFGGAVSHSLLGGMGAAVFLSTTLGIPFITPLWGSLAVALVLPFLIEWLRRYDRSDSLLSSLWALGMSLGTIFISFSKGYQRDLMSYLFGNVLLTTNQEVWGLAFFTTVVLIIFFLFLPQILLLSFDPDWFFLSFRSPSAGASRALLCLLSVGVVILSKVVGIVLVIALLTLPASTANLVTFKIFHLLGLTFILGIVSFGLGLMMSYLWDMPSGSSIVAVMGILYFTCILIKRGRFHLKG